MRRFLPLILFFLALSLPMFAQTALPTTTVDYIVYGYPYTYVNLNANDIPITIGTVPYYFNVDAHSDVNGNCVAPYCNVTFQNLNTGQEISVSYTGGFSPLPAYGKATTLSGTFSGTFNGSFVMNIVPVVPKPPCGRFGCRLYYIQSGSTLTLH